MQKCHDTLTANYDMDTIAASGDKNSAYRHNHSQTEGSCHHLTTHHGTIMANKAQFGTYFVWLHAIKYDSYMYTHHVKPGDLPVADQTLLHLSLHMEK